MVKTAVILAAGKGSKIFPFGDTWQKAALPVANKPVIVWQVEALRECGIERFVVVTGHFGGQVRTALEDTSSVVFVEQPAQSGTADALLLALETVSDKDFLVVYGDTLFTAADIKSLIDESNSRKLPAALLQPLKGNPPQEWLCANVENNRIVQIIGHPREASHRLCGIFALSKEIEPFLRSNPGVMTSVEVGNMPPAESELAESLSQFVQKGNALNAVECKGVFEDIDKPWYLLDANTKWLQHLCSNLKSNTIAETAKVSPDAEIDGYIAVGEHSVIGKGAKIKGNLIVGNHTQIIDGPIIGENCSIGEHSVVREYAKLEPLTAIGHYCVVGHCAEYGGLLMDGAYTYHYGEYWGILGRSSDLGAATVCGTLRFDDQNTIHRTKGRRDATRSASANASYLGDYVRTGVNAILMPGVKVGAYSVIGAGVILNEDLPMKSSIFVKQDYIRSNWGPEKYGW